MSANNFLTRIAATLIAIATVSGCVTTTETTRPGATGIKSKSLMLIDAGILNRQAAAIYREQLAKAEDNGRLNASPVTTERLRAIGERLVAHVAVFRDDAPHWRIQMVKSQLGQLDPVICFARRFLPA